MWHSAINGLANISGNMMHACYRPSPAPIDVSGNTSNDFIRSRTKPAFRIRYSQPFKGVERYCQENYESRVKSVSTEREIQLGFLPLFVWGYGEVVLSLQVCRQVHPDTDPLHASRDCTFSVSNLCSGSSPVR